MEGKLLGTKDNAGTRNDAYKWVHVNVLEIEIKSF